MSKCFECGEPVTDDPNGSPGVLVHDADELGNQAFDLDEDHAPYIEGEARAPDGGPGSVGTVSARDRQDAADAGKPIWWD